MKNKKALFLSVTLLYVLGAVPIQADVRQTLSDYAQAGIQKAQAAYEAGHEYVTGAKAKQAAANKALWSAVSNDDVAGVKQALAAGADMYSVYMVQASDGGIEATPAHYAALRGHTNALQTLINSGFDVNRIDPIGSLPIHSAAITRSTDAIDLLLKSGTPINARDKYGRTILIEVSGTRDKDLKLVEMLLERGANVNARDNLGQTPLINAAIYGNLELVKELIAHGATTAARGILGTAAESAARFDHTDVAEYLNSLEQEQTQE